MTSDGTFNYTYDNEGNRLTKTRISSATADDYKTEYTWDHRNRLTGVTLKNNSNTKKKELLYDYDHQNRLVRRKIDSDGNGTIDQTDVYVHDGYQIVLQFEVASSANLTATNLIKRYLWGKNPDELLTDEMASGGVLWAATDHLGSIRDLLRLSGSTTSVANHLTYNAFGKLVSKTSVAAADTTRFAYTGKWTDSVSGLQWNINRWYDAPTGKWISEDPIGFEGDDVNLYRYVRNNLVIYRDIYGKSKDIFVSAFNSGVIRATQRVIEGKSNILAHFSVVFNIRQFLLKLSDNLLSQPYKFKMVDKVSGGALAKYYPYWNTFEFAADIIDDGNVAIHETAHGYNDTKLRIWSADYDEALAYMLQAMVQSGFTYNFKAWEEMLEGDCPVEDADTLKDFEKQWSYAVWDLSIRALTGVMVSSGGASAGRAITEKDYKNLEKDYKIVISCEKYKKWSLEKIIKNWGSKCDIICITLKCPNSLWAVFK